MSASRRGSSTLRGWGTPARGVGAHRTKRECVTKRGIVEDRMRGACRPRRQIAVGLLSCRRKFAPRHTPRRSTAPYQPHAHHHPMNRHQALQHYARPCTAVLRTVNDTPCTSIEPPPSTATQTLHCSTAPVGPQTPVQPHTGPALGGGSSHTKHRTAARHQTPHCPLDYNA